MPTTRMTEPFTAATSRLHGDIERAIRLILVNISSNPYLPYWCRLNSVTIVSGDRYMSHYVRVSVSYRPRRGDRRRWNEHDRCIGLAIDLSATCTSEGTMRIIEVLSQAILEDFEHACLGNSNLNVGYAMNVPVPPSLNVRTYLPNQPLSRRDIEATYATVNISRA